MADPALPPVVVETLFDGLVIRYDERVLVPRSWTVLQARWAARLLPSLPEGPVLELCAGAGQIGLAAVRRSGRPLVCVERDPVAAAYAAANAENAGLAARVEVRVAPVDQALRTDELFPLVIADPPWVRRADTGRYPADPLTAIDGGEDGLDVARVCLRVAADHLVAGGAVLLQLGTGRQVDELRSDAGQLGLECTEVRLGQRGLVARFD